MKGTSEVGWASALAVPGTNSAIRDSGSLHVSALSSLGWVPPCSCTMAASGSTCSLSTYWTREISLPLLSSKKQRRICLGASSRPPHQSSLAGALARARSRTTPGPRDGCPSVSQAACVEMSSPDFSIITQ